MTALARTLLFTLACTTLSGIPAAARASSWQDNALSYVHGTEFTEPGNRREVRKDIVQFTHASGYALGQNFFSLKVLRSDATDPKKGSSRGATEGYLVYRHQLHLGKAFERSFAFGPVKEVALSAGFDLNTKDTAFSPRKRVVVVGPTFKFDVPGYLDLSLMVGKEWNRCRLGAPICPQREIGFDPQWMVNVVWGIPFRAGAVPLQFEGFLAINGEKGRDYAGTKTGTETLMRAALMVDVGQMAWGRKKSLLVGVGYEYWRNKFGNQTYPDGRALPGVDTDAPTLQLAWNF